MKEILSNTNPEENISRQGLINRMEGIRSIKQLEQYMLEEVDRYKMSFSLSDQVEINLAYLEHLAKLESEKKNNTRELDHSTRDIKLQLLKMTSSERDDYIKKNALFKYKSKAIESAVNFAQQTQETLANSDLTSVEELRKLNNNRLCAALERLLKSSPGEINNPAYEPDATDVISVELKQRYCRALLENALQASEDEKADLIRIMSTAAAFNPQPEYDAIVAILSMSEKLAEIRVLAKEMSEEIQYLSNQNAREEFITESNYQIIPKIAELCTVWSSEIAYNFSPAFLQSVSMDLSSFIDLIILQLDQPPTYPELAASQIQLLSNLSIYEGAQLDEELKVECYNKFLEIYSKKILSQVIQKQNTKIEFLAEKLYEQGTLDKSMLSDIYLDIEQLLDVAGTIKDKKILDKIFQTILELHINIQSSLFKHFGSGSEEFKLFLHTQDFIFVQTTDLIAPRSVSINQKMADEYSEFSDRDLRDAHPELYLKLYIKLIDNFKSLVAEKRSLPKEVEDDSVPHINEIIDLQTALKAQLSALTATIQQSRIKLGI